MRGRWRVPVGRALLIGAAVLAAVLGSWPQSGPSPDLRVGRGVPDHDDDSDHDSDHDRETDDHHRQGHDDHDHGHGRGAAHDDHAADDHGPGEPRDHRPSRPTVAPTTVAPATVAPTTVPPTTPAPTVTSLPPTTVPAVRTLTLSQPSIEPGGQMTVHGNGCLPAADVRVAIGDEPVGAAVADGRGAFSAPISAFLDLALGRYNVVATCGPSR